MRAAGDAAQMLLAPGAFGGTAFIARAPVRQGSVIGTPFGAWFSHPTRHGWRDIFYPGRCRMLSGSHVASSGKAISTNTIS
ncbi:MAG: hypothetical protein OXD29_15610, partial [Roseovarius sp.]|nr:hypothetical protein [Roseovarius sp.]